MNTISIDIPESVLTRIGDIVERKVGEALEKRANQILAEPRLLTRAEAAKLLRVTVQTLNNYRRNGSLIPNRGGRKVLYDLESIETFLKRRSI